MIRRKTAALMGCAAEMGARLGTSDEEIIQRLRSFGQVVGIAFQVRDDILGIWASSAKSGKTAAGDIYRRKKSLPVLHALEQANPGDQHLLREVYTQKEPVTASQVESVLALFARTKTKSSCCSFLAEQCHPAHEALASVPRNNNPAAARALKDRETLVSFVRKELWRRIRGKSP